jgi:hypothetical protein
VPVDPPSLSNRRYWARNRAYGRARGALQKAHPEEFRELFAEHFEACLLEEDEQVAQGIANGTYQEGGDQ